jgi:hypothetical protein
MKTKLLKFGLPVGLGTILLIMTIFTFISTTFVGCELFGCGEGNCEGNDGKCYSCSSGAACSSTARDGYTLTAEGHIYCYSGGGGGSTGCTPTGCSSSTPWYGCGSCWSTSDACHNRGTSNTSDDCSTCRKCP